MLDFTNVKPKTNIVISNIRYLLYFNILLIVTNSTRTLYFVRTVSSTRSYRASLRILQISSNGLASIVMKQYVLFFVHNKVSLQSACMQFVLVHFSSPSFYGTLL